MINVSDEFKNAIKQSGRQIRAYISNDITEINESDYLQFLKITSTGGLCKSIMRAAEAIYFQNTSFLDQYIHLGMGVVLPLVLNKGNFTVTIASPAVITLNNHGCETGDRIRISTTGNLPTGLSAGYYFAVKIDNNHLNISLTYEDSYNNILISTSGSQSGNHTLFLYPYNEYSDPEYIDYGSFKVISQQTNKGNEGITIKMFDKMYEALQQWDLEPTYDIVYPCTLLELLTAICTRLNWTLGTTDFPNKDLTIASDIFTGLKLSFRDVLDQIAEASGSIIYFGNDDTLKLRQVVTNILESLDKNTLNSLKVEPAYGPIDVVVLSREPQEDNIVKNSP